jgi:hypothetical protein
MVKLSDGSLWQIFPGDIDLTLAWLPTTEFQLFDINDHVASHGLINCDDGSVVRVRPPGERWPEERVMPCLNKVERQISAMRLALQLFRWRRRSVPIERSAP